MCQYILVDTNKRCDICPYTNMCEKEFPIWLNDMNVESATLVFNKIKELNNDARRDSQE